MNRYNIFNQPAERFLNMVHKEYTDRECPSLHVILGQSFFEENYFKNERWRGLVGDKESLRQKMSQNMDAKWHLGQVSAVFSKAVYDGVPLQLLDAALWGLDKATADLSIHQIWKQIWTDCGEDGKRGDIRMSCAFHLNEWEKPNNPNWHVHVAFTGYKSQFLRIYYDHVSRCKLKEPKLTMDTSIMVQKFRFLLFTNLHRQGKGKFTDEEKDIQRKITDFTIKDLTCHNSSLLVYIWRFLFKSPDCYLDDAKTPDVSLGSDYLYKAQGLDDCAFKTSSSVPFLRYLKVGGLYSSFFYSNVYKVFMETGMLKAFWTNRRGRIVLPHGHIEYKEEELYQLSIFELSDNLSVVNDKNCEEPVEFDWDYFDEQKLKQMDVVHERMRQELNLKDVFNDSFELEKVHEIEEQEKQKVITETFTDVCHYISEGFRLVWKKDLQGGLEWDAVAPFSSVEHESDASSTVRSIFNSEPEEEQEEEEEEVSSRATSRLVESIQSESSICNWQVKKLESEKLDMSVLNDVLIDVNLSKRQGCDLDDVELYGPLYHENKIQHPWVQGEIRPQYHISFDGNFEDVYYFTGKETINLYFSLNGHTNRCKSYQRFSSCNLLRLFGVMYGISRQQVQDFYFVHKGKVYPPEQLSDRWFIQPRGEYESESSFMQRIFAQRLEYANYKKKFGPCVHEMLTDNVEIIVAVPRLRGGGRVLEKTIKQDMKLKEMPMPMTPSSPCTIVLSQVEQISNNQDLRALCVPNELDDKKLVAQVSRNVRQTMVFKGEVRIKEWVLEYIRQAGFMPTIDVYNNMVHAIKMLGLLMAPLTHDKVFDNWYKDKAPVIAELQFERLDSLISHTILTCIDAFAETQVFKLFKQWCFDHVLSRQHVPHALMIIGPYNAGKTLFTKSMLMPYCVASLETRRFQPEEIYNKNVHFWQFGDFNNPKKEFLLHLQNVIDGNETFDIKSKNTSIECKSRPIIILMACDSRQEFDSKLSAIFGNQDEVAQFVKRLSVIEFTSCNAKEIDGTTVYSSPITDVFEIIPKWFRVEGIDALIVSRLWQMIYLHYEKYQQERLSEKEKGNELVLNPFNRDNIVYLNSLFRTLNVRDIDGHWEFAVKLVLQAELIMQKYKDSGIDEFSKIIHTYIAPDVSLFKSLEDSKAQVERFIFANLGNTEEIKKYMLKVSSVLKKECDLSKIPSRLFMSWTPDDMECDFFKLVCTKVATFPSEISKFMEMGEKDYNLRINFLMKQLEELYCITCKVYDKDAVLAAWDEYMHLTALSYGFVIDLKVKKVQKPRIRKAKHIDTPVPELLQMGTIKELLGYKDTPNGKQAFENVSFNVPASINKQHEVSPLSSKALFCQEDKLERFDGMEQSEESFDILRD